MNTRRGPQDLGWLRMMLASPWRVMCVVSAVFFLSEVQKFYDPNTGFSSLISIGDRVGENKVTQLKDVRHYVYEDSSGYDGAYYVQLALNPTLDNPELKTSIDNLPYRAKRILFCWTAWVLGLKLRPMALPKLLRCTVEEVTKATLECGQLHLMRTLLPLG